MSAAIQRDADGRDVVVTEDLVLGYGDTPVLQDVSFQVGSGEIFAIMGPSGCGKSTLMKALIGLLPIWSGHAEVAGQDVSSAPRETVHQRLAPHIGVLFQSAALVGRRTIGENVALPLEKVAELPSWLLDRTVRLSLDLVHLGAYANASPSELSGGMQRRAGLARAMAIDPKVLFCDEPSAGLDPSTGREIDLLLRELNEQLGVTIVLITHELASIRNLASRCIMLAPDGEGIMASGTLDEIRQSDDSRVQDFFRREIDDRRDGAGGGA